MKLTVRPDRNKASSLRRMAKVTLERLDGTDLFKYPSNTLIDYYNIIHLLMEAEAIGEGVKFKGEGAHVELIDHVARKNFPNQRIFLQDMRDYRNKISYEGFAIRESWLRSNDGKIRKVISKLEKK